jgi:hypothetical protein
LWHKAFKNSRYTEGYACKFLKTFYHQHLSTPHPQKSLNSGYKRFGRYRPESVRSIEQLVKDRNKKKRRAEKTERRKSKPGNKTG